MSEPAFASRFLDLATVTRLARLRFATRQIVEGPSLGRHASRRIGGSIEFTDFRPYTPGEDLRKLDWKVLGRLGRAYVRTFQDDTRLSATLVVDGSASMLFGAASESDTNGSKLDYARRLAASLAYVLTAGQDRAGLAMVSRGLDDFLAPGGSPIHLKRLLEMLELTTPRPITGLASGLRKLVNLLPHRGVLMVISDFLDPDLESVFTTLRLFRHRHFEIVCLHLIHPGEERLPEVRSCVFEGLENEGELISSPREIGEAYARRFAGFVGTVKALAHATGCEHRRVSTAQSWLSVLESFLVERQG